MATTLDEFFRIGQTIELGSHLFDAASIKAFASKFDPQPFHMDEEAAKNSVFGRLSASGWHTASMWMKYNMHTKTDTIPTRWRGDGPVPEFSASPGIRNLKWSKPVYAGETVRYTRLAEAHRPVASRPGWQMLTVIAAGYDSTGDKVIGFDTAVLVKVG